ncbi:RloB family protein [Janthinobacterium sp. RB2P8]|uniref:RloB family protein n=1 Tax=Janthinobacterium sp. RB2P8 TaxID=3424191 RepID=UPI003F22DF34
MARSANSFGRGGARFKAQPTVLVICEDSKSARKYLEDATIYFRVHVKVEITHIGKTDPKGIVTAAIERTKQYDRVFCAIDRDSHETFHEALRMAKFNEKVVVVPSYPCFEFWYLLHFGYTRKAYTSVGGASAGDRLVADLKTKKCMKDYAKGGEKGMFDALLPEFEVARRNSARALADAQRDGEINPSTTMHELMDFFESLSTPQVK